MKMSVQRWRGTPEKWCYGNQTGDRKEGGSDPLGRCLREGRLVQHGGGGVTVGRLQPEERKTVSLDNLPKGWAVS